MDILTKLDWLLCKYYIYTEFDKIGKCHSSILVLNDCE